MFCLVFYTVVFFPADCVLGEGKGVRGGASLLRMGPDTRMAGRTVPETRKCLEAHPQDLLFVFRLWHWLLQHLHFYTIMSLKKQYTVCLLLSKKMKPNFKRMLLCLRNARGAIKKKKKKKKKESLFSLLPAVQCSLYTFGSFPLPVYILTSSYNHTQTGFKVADFSLELTVVGCKKDHFLQVS